MCTIAGAKVQRNYNCYNVYFYECLPLLHLLSSLRKRFPDAKILGVSELDAKALHSKNIIVSDTMNQLRRTLSDLS